MGRCGLGGVKGHIKAFEKVKQGGAPCKIDAGGNSEGSGRLAVKITKAAQKHLVKAAVDKKAVSTSQKIWSLPFLHLKSSKK